MSEWHSVSLQTPENVEIETKIDDGKGVRNVTTLKRRGNLWWLPDMSMYCYYTPTHWRHPSDREGEP